MDDFQNIKKQFEELQNALKKQEDKVSILQNEIKEIDDKRRIAEEKAIESDKKLKITEEKYQKGLDLKDKIYQELIKDIFELPKQNIVESIKEQSLKSNKTTRRVTFLSIVISIIVSIFILTYSNFSSFNNQKEITSSLNEIKSSLDNINISLSGLSFYTEKIQKKTDLLFDKDIMIAQVINYIKSEQKEYSYNNFTTSNDISILYKMKLVEEFHDPEYLLIFPEALLKIGVRFELIPNIDDMTNWSNQYIELCKNVISEIDKFDSLKLLENVPENAEIRYYKNNRPKFDKTNYDTWYYSGSLTYEQLKSYFSDEMKNHSAILN